MEIIQQNQGSIGRVEFNTIQDMLSVEKDKKRKVKIPAPYEGMEFDNQVYVPVELKDSVMITGEKIMEDINNAKSNEEISNIIGNNVDLVASMLYNPASKTDYSIMLRNPAFTMVLKEKIVQAKSINVFTMYYLNNVIYRQFLEIEDDDNLIKLFKDLITVVNKEPINSIMSINNKEGITHPISSKDAIYISLARFSCPYEYPVRGCYRMNYAIANFEDSEVYTEQFMIYLYEQLFDNLNAITIGTLFKSVEFGQDYSMCNQEVIKNQINALLSILNFQPRDVIRLALYEYSTKFNQFGRDYKWLTIPLKQMDLDRYPLVVSAILSLNKVNIEVP